MVLSRSRDRNGTGKQISSLETRSRDGVDVEIAAALVTYPQLSGKRRKCRMSCSEESSPKV